MITLSDVTLVIVEPHQPDLAVKVLDVCTIGMSFGSTKLLTASKPTRSCKHELFRIPEFTYDEYNKFVVYNLIEAVDTPFCILCQTDGFILNPNRWTDEFYNWDYIGAKWDVNRLAYSCQWISPELKTGGPAAMNPVGNGGFSWRSRKLLQLGSECKTTFQGPEDAFICNNNRAYFESNGIRYAPASIADIWSQDPLIDKKSTFGFHGNKGIIYDYNL